MNSFVLEGDRMHMAKSKSKKSKTLKAISKQKEVKDYRHSEKRKNIPDSGLLNYHKEKLMKTKYEYDPHLDPQLQWAGKAEHTSFEVDNVPLHVHERISTQAIIDSVKQKQLIQTTLNLFGEPDIPLDKRIEFYEHDVDWNNRMILGDSLIVMNSLLENENMKGKVQMIYVDPPYGIAYDSNFQPFANKINVNDGKDEDLTREPEQIKAFRDTWDIEIHSYLTYLRDRLLLCRDLLSDSGSIFVQISDKNLHHIKELMDEVLGPKNFVSIIPFRKKTMPLGARYLERMHDYILWYARDFKNLKYHQLYQKQNVQGDSHWGWIELNDGTRRKMKKEEVNNHDLLPQDSKIFRLVPLWPASFSKKSVYPIKFRGKSYTPPPGQCWVTNPDGMARLINQNRIEPEGEGNLRYVYFFDDYNLKKLVSFWNDTTGARNAVYVVQTSEKVIERCISMTTDSSDLVFDPTCGSGTTASVAEKLGRRWITCDTSRVAIEIARQRLMTAKFDYYKLKHPDEGIVSGFDYKEVFRVSLKTIVNNTGPKPVTLYNQPEIDKSKIRVSGPFTVETISVPSTEFSQKLDESSQNPARPTNTAKDHITTMIEILKKTKTIHFAGNRTLELQNINPEKTNSFIHAIADSKDKKKIAVSFGPKHGPITVQQVMESVNSAQMFYDILIIAGFAITDESQAFIQKNPHPKLELLFANIQQDIYLNDLLKTPKGTQIFSVFGQPDLSIKKSGREYTVTLKGIDIYDPIEGKTEQAKGDNVAAWFLDSNYDGFTFRISQAFFPTGAMAKNPWDKLEKTLNGIVDTEKMHQFRSTKSIPFETGDHKQIAVKVIDLRGNEMVAVRKL